MTHDHPAPVTVLGLGPMGQALAGAFLAQGHPTTVWNRTAARAGGLVARGATRADTGAAAGGRPAPPGPHPAGTPAGGARPEPADDRLRDRLRRGAGNRRPGRRRAE